MEGFALAFIVLAFVSFPADASDLQVLCEGNDLSGWVKCEENHVLHIATAKYGRDSDIMCEGVNSSAMCGMHDVYDIIRPVCEGKQRCDSFIVNRENLGTIEKCKHVNIYLKMFTGCIKTEEPDDNKPRRPKVEEISKNGARFIATQDDTTRTNDVQFKQELNGSSWSRSMESIVLFVTMLAIFCGFY